MGLKETFQKGAEDVRTSPTKLARPGYPGANFGTEPSPDLSQQWQANATSQEELLARQNPGARSSIAAQHDKHIQQQKAADDLDVVLQSEALRKAYSRFQDTYTETMAFYEEADERIDDLENRLKDQINDLDARTVLLIGPNGEPVYQDEGGGFYALRQGQRVAITDEGAVASLQEQARKIVGNGQSVRTEAEQANYEALVQTLTETLDLKRDVRDRRTGADRWKEKIDDDPSLAPEGRKQIQQGRDDIERRLEQLERKVDGLDVRRDGFDVQQDADQAPETNTLDNWRASAPANTGQQPPVGL